MRHIAQRCDTTQKFYAQVERPLLRVVTTILRRMRQIAQRWRKGTAKRNKTKEKTKLKSEIKYAPSRSATRTT